MSDLKANSKTIHMHLDSGNHKLKVPLVSGERTFSMREHLAVSSFIDDIMTEDQSVKSVIVYTKDGDRVSRATPVDVLLREDWQVQIDGQRYDIRSPPRSLIGKQYISLHPELVKGDDQMEKLRSHLKELSSKQSRVSHAEIIKYAEDHGITHHKTSLYLKTLHKLGEILWLDDNNEMAQTIILNTPQIAMKIEEHLKLPEMRKQTESKLEEELVKLQKRFEQMAGDYYLIDAKAARSANFISYAVLGGLLFQWLLFARFTWWDFSWDVMEPVTYFTMTAEFSVTAYIYYLFKSDEYTHVDMWKALYNWRFKSIAKRHGFSIQEWNSVNDGIEKTREALTWYGE